MSSLLRHAAGRWGDHGEMLDEWRAELSAMDSPLARLKYALSLAVSRPHRIGTLPLRRTIPGIFLSLFFVLALPAVYLRFAVDWWGYYSSDTLRWQSWLAAANVVGAVAVAIVAAHLTAGLTNVVKPLLLPVWVLGMPYLFYMSTRAGTGISRADYLDLTAWLVGAIVFGMMAVRLTRHGRPVAAWACVAVAVPIVFLLGNLHGLGWYLDPEARLPFFDSVAVTVAFEMVTQPAFHLTVFYLAHVRSLAARVRTVDLPQREAVRAPL